MQYFCRDKLKRELQQQQAYERNSYNRSHMFDREIVKLAPIWGCMLIAYWG